MGFFSGLAKGYTTGLQMKADKEKEEALNKYRDQEFQYKLDRDAVLDQQYADNQEYLRSRDEVLDKRAEEDYQLRLDRLAIEQAAENRLREASEANISLSQDTLKLQKDRLDFDESMSKEDLKFKREQLDQNDLHFMREQERLNRNETQRMKEAAKEFAFKEGEAQRAISRFRMQFGLDERIALSNDDLKRAMFDYEKTRDTVTDDQWQKTFDYNENERKAAHERWKIDNAFKEDRALTADEQFEAEMAWRREQFETTTKDARTKLALEYGGYGAASKAFGGGGRRTSTVKTPTATEMAESVQLLTTRVGDVTQYPKEDAEYFNKILAHPGASHKVMTFLNEQAEAGNIIPIDEVPNLITIAASIPEQGDREAYLDAASGNIDIDNAEAFANSIMALNYIPATLQLDIKPEAYLSMQDATALEKQRDAFIDVVQGRAIDLANALTSSPKGSADHTRGTEILTAISYIESNNADQRALGNARLLKLIPVGQYISEIEKQDRGGLFRNLSQNSLLADYVVEEQAESGSIPTEISKEEPKIETKTEGEIPTFSTLDEAVAWIQAGNTGEFIDHEGIKRTVKPKGDAIEQGFKDQKAASGKVETETKTDTSTDTDTSADKTTTDTTLEKIELPSTSPKVQATTQKEISNVLTKGEDKTLTEIITELEELDPLPQENTDDELLNSLTTSLKAAMDAGLKTEKDVDKWLSANVNFGKNNSANRARRKMLKKTLIQALKID